ncbi:MAG: type II secretion system F family protein [Tissierellia bacterium]|nr:type II secretion system F family protein [Tissierellia bacterium]
MEFNYKAVDRNFELFQGVIGAKDLEEAKREVYNLGLRPLSLQEKKGGLKRALGSRKLSYKEMALLFQSMALLAQGGLDFPSIFRLLSRQKKSWKGQALRKMEADIDRGSLLSQAFDRAEIFPPLVSSMVQAGEESSSIERVLGDLGKEYEDRAHFRDKLVVALTYPLILLLTSFVVVQIVLRFVLPVFRDVFSGQEASLPWQTRFLMGASDHLSLYGNFYLLAFLCLVLALLVAYRKGPGRARLHRLRYQLSPLYRLHFQLSFAQSLSLQVGSGVPLLVALANIQVLSDNVYIQGEISQLARRLLRGQGFSEAMEAGGLIGEDWLIILKSGEEASNLSQTLGVLSRFLKHDLEHKLVSLSSLVEPVLIILMAIFVAFIVFAIAIPMFDLSNQL